MTETKCIGCGNTLDHSNDGHVHRWYCSSRCANSDHNKNGPVGGHENYIRKRLFQQARQKDETAIAALKEVYKIKKLVLGGVEII